MALSRTLREQNRSPTIQELAAIGYAQTLLADGHTLPPLMVSLGISSPYMFLIYKGNLATVLVRILM